MLQIFLLIEFCWRRVHLVPCENRTIQDQKWRYLIHENEMNKYYAYPTIMEGLLIKKAICNCENRQCGNELHSQPITIVTKEGIMSIFVSRV